MERRPTTLTQALELADHASPAPAEAAEALKTLRAELLRLEVIGAAAADRWISVDAHLPEIGVPVWLRSGASCFVGGRVLVDDAEWYWCEAGDQFWSAPDGAWEANLEYDGSSFEVTHWLPLPSLIAGEAPHVPSRLTHGASAGAGDHYSRSEPTGIAPQAEVFLVQYVKDGEAWNHKWYVPRWGDHDPSALDGRPISWDGKDRPDLGTYRVKALVPAETVQLLAFVPIHPRLGPLWNDSYAAGATPLRARYPVMPLFSSRQDMLTSMTAVQPGDPATEQPGPDVQKLATFTANQAQALLDAFGGEPCVYDLFWCPAGFVAADDGSGMAEGLYISSRDYPEDGFIPLGAEDEDSAPAPVRDAHLPDAVTAWLDAKREHKRLARAYDGLLARAVRLGISTIDATHERQALLAQQRVVNALIEPMFDALSGATRLESDT